MKAQTNTNHRLITQALYAIGITMRRRQDNARLSILTRGLAHCLHLPSVGRPRPLLNTTLLHESSK